MGAFARDLDHALGGDRTHATFTSFFPVPPNEVIKLGLESEIERVSHFDHVAGAIKLPKNAQETLGSIRETCTAGAAALKLREDAVKAEAVVWLRASQLKADANAVRRAVFNALERYAIEHTLGAEYPARVFPLEPRAKKATKATKPADAAPTEPTAPKG